MDMKIRIEQITPEIAKDYLKANIENRKVRRDIVSSLAEKMSSGKWSENGESIIFDKNGVLKDGQHRLHAVIKAKHSYQAVIVSGVETDVMETIDIGKNRTLGDILYLNGYTSVNLLASTAKAIIIYNRRQQKGTQSSKRVDNGVGLGYVSKHYKTLKQYINVAQKINQKSTRANSATFVALALHIVAKGKPPTDLHEEFIKKITGVSVLEGTASAWFFSLQQKAKKDRIRLNEYWKVGILIQAWNLLVQGDALIRYLKFDVEDPLPDVL